MSIHGHALIVRIDRDGRRSFNRRSTFGIARAIGCPVETLVRAITREAVRLADPALGITATQFEIQIRLGSNDGKVWAGKSSACLNGT